ncbi:hypothetical protein [Aquimonas sp.]|jgi:hypothetical protein|uniref:hypothetical protein n=1 Tax=Aquimonas sp. TaxID=1872588 RepID=UPI0037C17EAE
MHRARSFWPVVATRPVDAHRPLSLALSAALALAFTLPEGADASAVTLDRVVSAPFAFHQCARLGGF